MHVRATGTAIVTRRRPSGAMVVGAIAAVLLAASAVVYLTRPAPSVLPLSRYPVGSTLAAFSLPGTDGHAVRAPWAAHDPSIVLFTASWCPGCKAELATLARVAGTGHLGGVRVIAVDGDNTAAAARRFVAGTGTRFPVGVDPFLVLSSRLVPRGEPAVLYVTAAGRVMRADYGTLTDTDLSAGLSLLHRT